MANLSNPPSSSFSKRLLLMRAGLEELEHWLQDTFRQGLANLEQQPFSFWKEISARMVDAKLGGIGKRLLRLASIIGQQDNWHETVLEELGNFFLLIRGLRHIDQLPPSLQTDLLNFAGVNTKKEAVLKSDQIIKDTWMCLAVDIQEEDNLRARKTWLYGWTSHRYALVLDFAWGRTDFTERYQAGTVFSGAVAYYPSNTPLRVIVKEKQILPKRTIKRVLGLPTFSDFLQQYATSLANNPWIMNFPCGLEEIRPALEKGQLHLIDAEDLIIPINITPQQQWQIIAMSGGHPINLFGEWTGKVFLPLCISANDQFCAL